MEFNQLIHQQRGRLIEIMPKGAEVVLSAGCSGAWYFEWFEKKYGHVDKHIGLELHIKKPEELPENVEWISNSVDDMSSVSNKSVDMLFSGQNIEHLDSRTLLGFLKEANRVLRPDGCLVIDSPNRKVTQPKRYFQPEHTLELSNNEINELVLLAGFHVENIYGIWHCRSTNSEFDKQPVTFLPDDIQELDERLDAARDDVDQSFIWWLVAKKTGHIQEQALTLKIEDIYLKDFPGFVRNRFLNQVGQLHYAGGTESIISVSRKESGYVIFGALYSCTTRNIYCLFPLQTAQTNWIN